MHFTGHQNLKLVEAITPDAHTVGAVNGTGIDTKGFREATFLVQYGTAGTSLDFKIQESSDNGVSDAFADISGAAITQLTAGGEQAIIRLNQENHERYIRAVLTAGGTEDASAMCVLSNPEELPVTQDADETVNADS